MSATWKTALVTGASSGLGRGLAAWLAKQDVRVYAAARRLDQLEQLKAEAGENIVPLQLDVSDGEATYAAVAKLDADAGGLDLVVANAGVGEETRPKRLKWDSIQRMIDVNVTGATATLCGALPGMVERGRGHLVGISSLAGFVPLPRNSTYSATKAYLGVFCESLRFDVEHLGLTVTSVHPGFMKSAMTAKNKPASMPFILEMDDAVDRIGRALLRKEPRFAFPWQLSAAVSAATTMPQSLQSVVLRRLR